MAIPFISYGSGPTTFLFSPQNFLPEDAPTVHDNISTSGLLERVFESNAILISFTMPGLAAGDLLIWKSLYAWARSGSAFLLGPGGPFGPPPPFLYSPWTFNCVLEDPGFKPKRVGLGRYSLDCKFRTVPGALPQPQDAGSILMAFNGDVPSP